MELHSTERGGRIFIVTPISAVLQPYKVISVIGRIVAGTSSPVWYRLYSTSRLGARRESVIVGNRGLVVEEHHFLTPCFAVMHAISATCSTRALHFPAPLA